ncbi:hypothetical protein [Viridibacillus soli]|nr:hypothetical protein [Viridibacillus soli]
MQLYQDFVCKYALRVARELFTILPTERIQIDICGELLADDIPQ